VGTQFIELWKLVLVYELEEDVNFDTHTILLRPPPVCTGPFLGMTCKRQRQSPLVEGKLKRSRYRRPARWPWTRNGRRPAPSM
jgi:hypothetical protein